MKYDSSKYRKLFTIEEVRILIAERYDQKKNGNSVTRPLYIHKSNCCYRVAGCLFFALNGSPPKGYALYSPEHSYLLVIDAFGKTTKYNNCVLVDDNGNHVDINSFEDTVILK